MPDLNDKVIVITGGGRGIGLAIARACAEEGAQIALMGRHADVLRRAAKGIPGGALAVAADVTRPGDVSRAFGLIRKRSRRVDVLINNAGVFSYKPFERTTLGEWHRNIQTNLTSIFLVTRAALPLMARSQSPHLVNILSISSRQAFANCSAYTAAKFGALGLTRVLAQELREKGIRVTAVLPGATNTRMIDEFDFEVHRDQIVQPEDVAASVVGALLAPPRTTLEEIILTPSRGSL